MRISESRLRKTIRSVIAEAYDMDNYPEDMEGALERMIKSFNDLLELSRTTVYEEFCAKMESQMGTEGKKFCQALREIQLASIEGPRHLN